DVFVHRARRMAPPIARALAAAGDVDLCRLADLLSGWDHHYTLDTSAPAVFEAIVHHLAERVLAARLPARLVRILHRGGVALSARLLEGEPSAWFADAPVTAGAGASAGPTRRQRPDGEVAVAAPIGLEAEVASAAAERLEAEIVASAGAALADL